jgi:hypothetical protein
MPRWRRSQLSVGLERSLGFITIDRLGEPLLYICIFGMDIKHLHKFDQVTFGRFTFIQPFY